jgi:hypothetical protein
MTLIILPVVEMLGQCFEEILKNTKKNALELEWIATNLTRIAADDKFLSDLI